MAEEVDHFEAAMATKNDLDGANNEENGGNSQGETPQDASPIDPFEAALSAVAEEESDGEQGSDAPKDPFEAALSAVAEGKSDGEQGSDAPKDPFDAALQIARTEQSIVDTDTTEKSSGHARDLEFLLDIKLSITFEVGRAKMFISDLLSLGQGSVIELHRLVGEELEMFLNGRLFAMGEVVVVNEKFGGKISKIITPEERIQYLGSND